MKPSQQWRLFAAKLRDARFKDKPGQEGRKALLLACQAANAIADELDKEEELNAWCDHPV